ncbi:MAG: hypothetical protein KGQ57_00005 [Burkholderiales bacterium]|nr:hypothetical protein [Burkholderiales bacterium]
MNKTGTAAAIVGALLLAACSSKNDPTETNFASAINEHFSHADEECLPVTSYPVDVSSFMLKHPDASQVPELDALKNAGLLSTSVISPTQSRMVAGAVQRYQLTPMGLKYFHETSAVDATTGTRTGMFCYGHRSLLKVVRWVGPVTAGGYQGATVYFTYKYDDLPDWAKRPDVQAFYGDMRHDLAGIGNAEAHWAVRLTNEGWKPVS